jgi:hypothetical protein
MNKVLTISITALFVVAGVAFAQNIRVNPDGVNVNASGTTVVFLTFGPLSNKAPAEGCWCGEIVPAAPDLGFKCNPVTIFGCLPARNDLSTRSGNQGFTDIMSIPPSVARRAYQDAESGSNSSFFYVRRFVSLTGGPDEFVAVTCRMSGGGARTPFALTDVKLAFGDNHAKKPITALRVGEKPPRITAEISYNGTGRLKGRWEVVMPGDEPPAVRDLLTEASLPIEERAAQKRYTQIGRFNLFLPPGSRHILEGPDPSSLPNTIEGGYLVLLRIEAADDKEADSNLSVVGGNGIVHSGAVAGFPLPTLRYFVGSGITPPASRVTLLLPEDNTNASWSVPLDFTWTESADAAFCRIEIETLQSRPVISALLVRGTNRYRAPGWLKERLPDGRLRWRIVVLDEKGTAKGETVWRRLTLKQ